MSGRIVSVEIVICLNHLKIENTLDAFSATGTRSGCTETF